MRRLTALILAALPITASAETFEELQARVDQLQEYVANLDNSLAVRAQQSQSTADGSDVPNLIAVGDFNSIDPKTFSSTISAGGRDNFIGYGERDYTPGTARRAVIAGGYDNINNQLAGTISGGAHQRLYSAASHGTISGGSNSKIFGGHYATISGGTWNLLEGFAGTISGGQENVLTQNYSVIAGGIGNKANGYAGVISGGRRNTITESAKHAAILGGQNSLVSAPYAIAFGNAVVSDVGGGMAFAGRYNEQAGDAQAVQFHLSTVTTDESRKHMAVIGAWTRPTIPPDTAWSGRAYILARSSTGAISSWELPVVANRKGWNNYILEAENINPLVDQLNLGVEAVAVQMTRDGQLDLQVTGKQNQDIHWGAFVAVTQVR